MERGKSSGQRELFEPVTKPSGQWEPFDFERDGDRDVVRPRPGVETPEWLRLPTDD